MHFFFTSTPLGLLLPVSVSIAVSWYKFTLPHKHEHTLKPSLCNQRTLNHTHIHPQFAPSLSLSLSLAVSPQRLLSHCTWFPLQMLSVFLAGGDSKEKAGTRKCTHIHTHWIETYGNGKTELLKDQKSP